MVTQKNPDENVNHLPSATSRIVDGTILTSSENADAHKRFIFCFCLCCKYFSFALYCFLSCTECPLQ